MDAGRLKGFFICHGWHYAWQPTSYMDLPVPGGRTEAGDGHQWLLFQEPPTWFCPITSVAEDND